ncbi:MAG: glycosyltransferase family A protein [Candidatus Aenigmatarchaeota archaeon]
MNISVIIPAKNEEKFIGNCLKCLKRQSLKPLEIIVVDGHSTDKTFSIAKKYADKVVKDNKKGVSDARNVGWKISKGDIIAYCDADCLPPKDWIKNISKLMNGNICISGPLYPYDGNFSMKLSYKIWTDYITRLVSFLGFSYAWGSNMAIRKEILKKESFRTKILEDYDLVRRIRKFGKIGYYKELYMPVSCRHLRFGFHTSVIRFYLTNFLRLRLGLKEKVGDYWK